MTASVAEIWRYPVKGLAGEPLAETGVVAGQVLPGDRRFALARTSGEVDPDHPTWAFKTSFHMLMHGGDEALAALSPRLEAASGQLSISRDGRELIQAKATDSDGRGALNAFFADYLDLSGDGVPHFTEAQGFAFGNVEPQVISLINLASVADFDKVAGQETDTRRFRGNLNIAGLEPWVERDWVGKTLQIGELRFSVIDETIRCGATTVNPSSYARDLNVPKILQKAYGHMFCGIYLKALTDGNLSKGAALSLVD